MKKCCCLLIICLSLSFVVNQKTFGSSIEPLAETKKSKSLKILLPYILVPLAAVMVIGGSLYYTKHRENRHMHDRSRDESTNQIQREYGDININTAETENDVNKDQEEHNYRIKQITRDFNKEMDSYIDHSDSVSNIDAYKKDSQKSHKAYDDLKQKHINERAKMARENNERLNEFNALHSRENREQQIKLETTRFKERLKEDSEAAGKETAERFDPVCKKIIDRNERLRQLGNKIDYMDMKENERTIRENMNVKATINDNVRHAIRAGHQSFNNF